MTGPAIAIGHRTAGTAGRRLGRLLARIGRWYVERRTCAALARLDPHLLRDIGFDREIERRALRRRLLAP